MFTTTVTDNVQFAYRDNGPIKGQGSYMTLIMVHGHTYHSGIFTKLSSLAEAHHLRMISVNRRCYPGSTPFTDEELRILSSGTPDERSKMLDKQGEYLAMFIDNVIQEHGLHDVIVVGWSLGTVYLNTIVGSFERLSQERQKRLQNHVRAFVYLEPPSNLNGIEIPEGGWHPLYDDSLPPQERAPTFAKWVSNYFPHPDISSRELKGLCVKLDTPVKPPTFSDTPLEELQSMVDFTASAKVDSFFGRADFMPVMWGKITRALLDPETRTAWRNTKFFCLYGEETMWSVIWSVWRLDSEASIKASNDDRLTLFFKSMKGANHFMIYDTPELFLTTIQSCIDMIDM